MDNTTDSPKRKPKSRQELVQELPERFSQPHKDTILNLKLSHGAFRLWCIIDIGGSNGNWSYRDYDDYARLLDCNRRSVQRWVKELWNAELIKKFFDGPFGNQKVWFTSVRAHDTDVTRDKSVTPPMTQMSLPHDTDVLQNIRILNSTLPSEELAASPKRKSKKSGTTTSTRESVEAQIDALDLSKFRAQYPDLNVENEHERFRDHFLAKNDPKTGKPNWLKWNDWNSAFHRWLKNAREFVAERGPAPKPPEQPRKRKIMADENYY